MAFSRRRVDHYNAETSLSRRNMACLSRCGNVQKTLFSVLGFSFLHWTDEERRFLIDSDETWNRALESKNVSCNSWYRGCKERWPCQAVTALLRAE